MRLTINISHPTHPTCEKQEKVSTFSCKIKGHYPSGYLKMWWRCSVKYIISTQTNAIVSGLLSGKAMVKYMCVSYFPTCPILKLQYKTFLYPRSTVLPLSVRPSFRPSKIFFVALFSATIGGRYLIFGHKLRYAILWEAFLDLSDSYFLFADLVGFYTHWTYMRGYHKSALAHSSSCWTCFIKYRYVVEVCLTLSLCIMFYAYL